MTKPTTGDAASTATAAPSPKRRTSLAKAVSELRKGKRGGLRVSLSLWHMDRETLNSVAFDLVPSDAMTLRWLLDQLESRTAKASASSPRRRRKRTPRGWRVIQGGG
jgi:hypothetical protein